MSRSALNTKETIFALTTGSLPSGVAILKISGNLAFPIAQSLFEPFEKKPGMFLGKFKDHEGAFVDKGLLLSFVGPHSHTGEDTVEFHLHGSTAIVRALEYSIERLGGRRANPGEFSYRSYLNGKCSLEDLEDLGDVFSAQEESALKRIYGRRDGSIERKIIELRGHLLKVQAILDTAVDFADEYSSVVQSASTPLALVTQEITEISQRYSTLKSSLEAPKLVVAGRPNAGKSSLFNALLCRYRAIVHSEPGTTRDVIEEEIQLGGRSWKLVDTAGVRKAESSSERQGIEMGEEYLSGAQYWLLVVDGSEGLLPEDVLLLEKYHSLPHQVVWNKKDLSSWKAPSEPWIISESTAVSAQTGTGISELIAKIEMTLKELPQPKALPTPTRVQATALHRVLTTLNELSAGLSKNELPEYLAEMNRQSIQQLEGVIGAVEVDDVLDRVFSEFCIGK